MVWTSVHDYVLLGVDSILVGVMYALYRRRDHIIKNILDAPSVAVGPELTALLESSSENILPYATVRGRVQEMGQSIESSAGLKGVLQVITLNEHSYRRHAFGHWGDTVRTIHQAQNSVPFALKNLSPDKVVLIEVENPFDATMDNLLLTVSTNFSPSNATAVSTVVGFFTGVSVKGIEKTEEFLPVDTIMTGIGQIVRDSNGRIKLMQPRDDGKYPYVLSTLPVESIVKKLESGNTWLKFTTFVFATIGIIVAARRFHEWWKVRQLAKMREKILKQRTKVDLQNLTDAQICTVCLTNPREVILLNCGHVCCCADCCTKLNQKCPICREAIIGTHAAYLV